MSEDTPELVMPFVCTTDNGGPYDSTAFVAGARFEALRNRLEVVAKHATDAVVIEPIYPEMSAQCDLLAMHYGYTMTTEPWEEAPDEWLLARFAFVVEEDV